MGLRLEPVTTDAAGLPVVKWREDRNHHAGMAAAEMECRIMKDGATGELLFVNRGSVGFGPYEEGRLWQKLTGFSGGSANKTLYSAEEAHMRESLKTVLPQRLQWAGEQLQDHAWISQASFSDERPNQTMHITRASASPAEMSALDGVLYREFVARRPAYLEASRKAGFLREERLNGEQVFKADVGDKAIETYDPNRVDPALEKYRRDNFIANILFVLIVGSAALLVAWFTWFMGLWSPADIARWVGSHHS